MKPFVKKIVAHSKKEDKSGRFIKNGLIEIILFKIAILLALAVYGIYTDIASLKEKQLLIEGGPKTDYTIFYDNMVIWNLLTQKLEDYKLQVIRQRQFVELLQELKENIRIQLDD